MRRNAQDVFVSQGARGKWALEADNVMTSLCWTHLISRNVLGKCSQGSQEIGNTVGKANVMLTLILVSLGYA